MNTTELNNSSFDLLPLFPAMGIVLLLAAAMAVLWGILRPLLYRSKCESEYDAARHKRGRALSR